MKCYFKLLTGTTDARWKKKGECRKLHDRLSLELN
jgi:hypothetical protein